MSIIQILSAPVRASLRRACGSQAVVTTLLLALAGFWAAPRALAQPNSSPPERLTYQGFLADGNGAALATNAPKNYDVIFRIWDAQTGGASALWSEQQTVTVDKGYFSVLLGEGSQITSPATEPHNALSTLFTNATASDRYVEMTVKGIGTAGADVTILPRLRLLTSPYAFLASKVSGSGVISANNLDPAIGLWTANGTSIYKLAGNVGIGTTTPGENLTIAGVTGYSSGLKLTGNGVETGMAIENTSSGGRKYSLYSGSTASLGSGFAIYDNTANTWRLVISPAGNVGIGTTTPANKLSVSGSADFSGNVGIGTTTPGERLTIAGAGWNNGLKLTGNSPETGMAIENTSTGGRKYDLIAGSSTGGGGGPGLGIWDETGGAFRLNINAAGNIGIGTTTPTQGKLVVSGSASYLISSYDYFTLGGNLQGLRNNSFSDAISVYASHKIAASHFLAYSDERIKRIERHSDAARDLVTLMGMEVTDYTFIDTVAKGAGQQKKLIAQQVEKVYPQAIAKSTDVVPDIYKMAAINHGWVTLATNLKQGERVRLIGEKKEGIHEVLEVAEDRFRTDFMAEGDKVFVYGREVKDFRSVDYEAIAMLNVSATQELARRLEKVEARESHVAELERKAGRVETLEQEVADLKKLVAQLAEASKGSKQTARATPQNLPAAQDAPLQTASSIARLDR